MRVYYVLQELVSTKNSKLKDWNCGLGSATVSSAVLNEELG